MKTLITMLTLLAISVQGANLSVDDRPLVYRVLLANTPSRGIAVGYPTQFNVVIDSVRFTPLYVWNGGFLNLSNELKSRGGRACSIRGARVDLGLPLMPLRFADPAVEPNDLIFKGYRRSGREAPVFLAEIDGRAVTLQVTSRTRNQVTLRYTLPADRKATAYFALGTIRKDEVAPGPNASWAPDNNHLQIAADKTSFELTIDISARKATIQQEEKATGKSLYAQYCSACHSLSDQKLIGPSFKGLWGKEESVISNGKPHKITVNEDYVKRAIIDPQADVVEGYQAIPMPPFKGILSDSEIDLLIEFIQGQK